MLFGWIWNVHAVCCLDQTFWEIQLVWLEGWGYKPLIWVKYTPEHPHEMSKRQSPSIFKTPIQGIESWRYPQVREDDKKNKCTFFVWPNPKLKKIQKKYEYHSSQPISLSLPWFSKVSKVPCRSHISLYPGFKARLFQVNTKQLRS